MIQKNSIITQYNNCFTPVILRACGKYAVSKLERTLMSRSLSSQVVRFLVNSKIVWPLISSPLTRNQSSLSSIGGRDLSTAYRSYTIENTMQAIEMVTPGITVHSICTKFLLETINMYIHPNNVAAAMCRQLYMQVKCIPHT